MRGLLAIAIFAFMGCARVKAHQRGTLARPDMELGAGAELGAGEAHARQYREGSTGGGNGKAGGCGCN